MDRIMPDPHIEKYELTANGNFPNSELPVLIYRGVLILPQTKNPAATIAEKIFLSHQWKNTWRNGIYDFHHFHSNAHECMAICSGGANVVLGGPGGKRITLEQGDVIILPAGTGHRCTRHSDDFLVVGGYPRGIDYDMCTGDAVELGKAKKKIAGLSIPRYDPVFGKEGYIRQFWKKG